MHFNIGGWMLIIIGSIFLLQNLGIIPWNIIGHLWPVVLIVIGIGIIRRKRL